MKKISPLIFILSFFALGPGVSATPTDYAKRGDHPLVCVLDWEQRLFNARNEKSDPQKFLAETVVFGKSDTGDLGLLYEFMETNGWVKIVDFEAPDLIMFGPPYDERKNTFTDFERNQDSKYGLLVPCQASWLANIPIYKVFRRERGKVGDIAYEVKAP
ncbi:hypothetical protein [Parasphingorhabdus sp.]|uniref:hypothetical protein n=1 Tax=Parasphingorhabdus sp. TaxID=2709688 RepID=UPI003A8D2315